MNFSMASISSGLSYLPVVTASGILAAGVIDDLRSRKVHNVLFLICVAIALVVTMLVGGLQALFLAPIGFMAGFAVFLPLVLLNIVGAGDMKLMAAFGIVAGWNAVVAVAVFALIWGAIFGLVQVTLKGQLLQTFRNMLSIASMKERKSIELHKMPFTVAILMGWLSHLTYQGVL
jgi:prepilin peptidase CpaA